MKHFFVLFTAVILALSFAIAAAGESNVMTAKEYSEISTEELPAILGVGYTAECDAGIKLRILAQPSITKASNNRRAPDDLQFYFVRIGVTNNTNRSINLNQFSAFLDEVYLKRVFGTYSLNPFWSAAASVLGNGQMQYDWTIAPGKELLTTLAFLVYPDAESWILDLTPLEGQCNFRVTLPAPIKY